jgi:hypothetical protein
MTITTIRIDSKCIDRLDVSPVQRLVDQWLQDGSLATAQPDHPIRFQIDVTLAPDDPRELSEIPEIRLWFIRLDARYPWLPFLLDWEIELARYAAMLVPHQFSPTEGIQYNPEALEIFLMQKVFAIIDWMQEQGISSRTKLKFMTQVLGIELEDSFFELLGM